MARSRIKRFFGWFKYHIHFRTPNLLKDFYSSIAPSIRNRKYLETFKSFGHLNPEITFYVIRRRPPGWGFFSNFLFVCQGILHARNHGYEPVVDMENYWMQELSSIESINGTFNAWCYFFNQVSNYSLGEVYKSKNVILSDGFYPAGRGHFISARTSELINHPNCMKILQDIVSKNISLNKYTEDYIEKTRHAINFTPNDTLGIFIRGTVYFKEEMRLHFSVPDLQIFLKEIANILESNKILKNLFIVTEDFRIYKIITDKFKQYIPISLRYDSNMTETEWQRTQKTGFQGFVIMGYDKTLTYLTEAILLSSCEFFIATYSNLSASVLSFSDLSKGVHKIVTSDRIVDIRL